MREGPTGARVDRHPSDRAAARNRWRSGTPGDVVEDAVLAWGVPMLRCLGTHCVELGWPAPRGPTQLFPKAGQAVRRDHGHLLAERRDRQGRGTSREGWFAALPGSISCPTANRPRRAIMAHDSHVPGGWGGSPRVSAFACRTLDGGLDSMARLGVVTCSLLHPVPAAPRRRRTDLPRPGVGARVLAKLQRSPPQPGGRGVARTRERSVLGLKMTPRDIKRGRGQGKTAHVGVLSSSSLL